MVAVAGDADGDAAGIEHPGAVALHEIEADGTKPLLLAQVDGDVEGSHAGMHDGFFTAAEEQSIVNDIRNSGAQILFVALGVPKQEKWISRHLYELGPCVCMGVGGTFDVLAGKVCRAPEWMRRNRLEWLYRLCKEPSRAWRMLALPKFVAAVKFGSNS